MDPSPFGEVATLLMGSHDSFRKYLISSQVNVTVLSDNEILYNENGVRNDNS